MSDKFRNRYRIPSARLQKWDYRWPAAYFITIVMQNRECYFGKIAKTQWIASPYKMELSEIGLIVDSEWKKTLIMRPDMNLQMGEYIIMPNHFHAIVVIGQNEYNQSGDERRDEQRDERRDAMHCVSTPPPQPKKPNQFGPQSKNLSSFILDQQSFERIQSYIINNPSKWNDDQFRNQNK